MDKWNKKKVFQWRNEATTLDFPLRLVRDVFYLLKKEFVSPSHIMKYLVSSDLNIFIILLGVWKEREREEMQSNKRSISRFSWKRRKLDSSLSCFVCACAVEHYPLAASVFASWIEITTCFSSDKRKVKLTAQKKISFRVDWWNEKKRREKKVKCKFVFCLVNCKCARMSSL